MPKDDGGLAWDRLLVVECLTCCEKGRWVTTNARGIERVRR